MPPTSNDVPTPCQARVLSKLALQGAYIPLGEAGDLPQSRYCIRPSLDLFIRRTTLSALERRQWVARRPVPDGFLLERGAYITDEGRAALQRARSAGSIR